MPPPINLNRYRKARARAEAVAEAATNRVKFGRTKGEKAAQTEAQGKTAREHAGRRLEPQAPVQTEDPSAPADAKPA